MATVIKTILVIGFTLFIILITAIPKGLSYIWFWSWYPDGEEDNEYFDAVIALTLSIFGTIDD